MKKLLLIVLVSMTMSVTVVTEMGDAKADSAQCAVMDARIIQAQLPSDFHKIGRRESNCQLDAHNRNRGTGDFSVCWFQINFVQKSVVDLYVSNGFGVWNVFTEYGCINLTVFLYNMCGIRPWIKPYGCKPPAVKAVPVPAPWEVPLALAA